MGFHFTLLIGEESYTWKSRYTDVEIICDLESKYGAPTGLARSACVANTGECVENVATLMGEINHAVSVIAKSGGVLFKSYAYRLRKHGGRKYGQATTQDWMHAIDTVDESGTRTCLVYQVLVGRNICEIHKTLGKNGKVLGFPEVTDLRQLDEYDLPDGSTIQIIQKPMQDMLTPELESAVSFLENYPSSATVKINSG